VGRDELYIEAARTFGSALQRLVRVYESDADKARDLLQDIHIALWQSFETFDGRCSLRTWVYRVAHCAAASHVVKQLRSKGRGLVSLEEMDERESAAALSTERDVSDRIVLERMMNLIHQLQPMDRQLMLLYLEDVDAATIGEITGISPGNVRNRIYRIKAILSRRLGSGTP
jgi:RNA polymerase sigma-70 factor (ECF subfamily)